MSYYEDADFLLRFFSIYKVGYMRKKLCRIRRHEFNTDKVCNETNKKYSDYHLVQNIFNFNKQLGWPNNKKMLTVALKNSFIRLATYYFRQHDYKQARKSLISSLRIKVNYKGLFRLAFLPFGVLLTKAGIKI